MKTGAIPLQTQQALTTTNTKAAPLTQEQQLSSGSYTIQLASYMNTKDAQAAAQSLRKKGFTAVILTKGKYSVLCVGRFSNKEKAQALLSEFRKNSSYKDSFIRRL
jgi:cell division septation protein DedD